MDIIICAARCPSGTEHDFAYLLLARVLERELGLAPLPAIQRASGGKPFFPNHPDICFNLSHSHGAAACAVHNRPIGIDLEKLRPAPRRLANGMDSETFFRLWTAKEATIKREGLGLGALRKLTEPDPRCRCLEGLLEGWTVTVCPSEEADIKIVRLE